MKNLKKILASLFIIFAIAMIYNLPVSAAQANFRMTSDPQPGDTRIEIAWNTIYKSDIGTYCTAINYYYIMDTTNNVQYGNFYGNGAYGDFDLGYHANWSLYVNYSTSWGTTSNSYLGSITVNNSPASMSKSNFVFDYANSSTVYVKTATPDTASGVQVAVYKSGKLTDLREGYSYIGVSAKQNALYNIRVRAYYTNYDTGKTYYGKWTPYRKYAYPKVSGKATNKKKGFSISFNKVAGVTSYKIYVSTKANSGYKLSKTVTFSKKTKYTYQITKNVKKKTRNYIKVVPYIKGYGNADCYFKGSIYVYK